MVGAIVWSRKLSDDIVEQAVREFYQRFTLPVWRFSAEREVLERQLFQLASIVISQFARERARRRDVPLPARATLPGHETPAHDEIFARYVSGQLSLREAIRLYARAQMPSL